MPTNEDKTHEAIKKMMNEIDNERAIDIFVKNNATKEFGLNLSTGLTESIQFNDNKQFPTNISDSAIQILEEFVIKEKPSLIKYANQYQTARRQFYSFLYDVTGLVKYLSELPINFRKLLRIDGDADTLMHKRIQAEIATKYAIKGFNVDLEIKNNKGKKMDLIINSVETEIKTIISPTENSKDSCMKFANTITEKYEKAQEQFENKGILCVAPWSIVMNNILKEYYAGLYSTELPEIKEDKSILIISGEIAFEDYYLEFDSNKILNSINFFANTGFDYTHPMSYLEVVRRRGFPVSRGGKMEDISKTGLFYFNMG